MICVEAFDRFRQPLESRSTFVCFDTDFVESTQFIVSPFRFPAVNCVNQRGDKSLHRTRVSNRIVERDVKYGKPTDHGGEQ